MTKAVFKPTNQHQPALFPFDFDALVDKSHPVRIVDHVIEKIDISSILNSYQGGGASSYHPRMLLKVIIFGYLNNQYSSRKIARAIRENIHYMWLSGQNFPDFRTINKFRGQRLKGNIDEIFKQVVLLLHDKGIISLKEVFIDGTKIESFANRYTFIWKKNVERHKGNLELKIQSILKDISNAIEQDDKEANNLKEEQPTVGISSIELDEKIKEINQKLKNKDVTRTIKKKIKELEEKSLPKLLEYEKHLDILGDRNSYS